MPIAQNPALFSLLGTTYGGDGESTFALPNLQGRAPLHPGAGTGLSLRDLGETGGLAAIVLQNVRSRRTTMDHFPCTTSRARVGHREQQRTWPEPKQHLWPGDEPRRHG